MRSTTVLHKMLEMHCKHPATEQILVERFNIAAEICWKTRALQIYGLHHTHAGIDCHVDLNYTTLGSTHRSTHRQHLTIPPSAVDIVRRTSKPLTIPPSAAHTVRYTGKPLTIPPSAAHTVRQAGHATTESWSQEQINKYTRYMLICVL